MSKENEKQEEQPKIHIDADWKAQAQAEKERLTREGESKQTAGDAGSAAGGGATGPGADAAAGQSQQEIPPATFQTLLSTMISQALMYMGGIADPQTGKAMIHLDAAKHSIDLLGILEEKTKGNLSDEESKLLSQALNELRMSFLSLKKQVEDHIQKQAQEGATGANLKTPGN